MLPELPAPDTAAPVARIIEPDAPALEVPVLRVMVPLTPLLPALGVESVIPPLVVWVP